MERPEYLDELDEDEQEKPGKTPHQKTLQKNTHTHLPSKNTAPPTISAASRSPTKTQSMGSEGRDRVNPQEENQIKHGKG